MVDGIGTAAKFHTPRTLTLDSYNNMYIIDLGPEQHTEASPSNVARLRVLGLEHGAVTSTFEVTELRSDLLTPYEQSNAEVTNQDPVVVSGVSYPVMDVTPNVSIKNTDNTAMVRFLNYQTKEDLLTQELIMMCGEMILE